MIGTYAKFMKHAFLLCVRDRYVVRIDHYGIKSLTIVVNLQDSVYGIEFILQNFSMLGIFRGRIDEFLSKSDVSMKHILLQFRSSLDQSKYARSSKNVYVFTNLRIFILELSRLRCRRITDLSISLIRRDKR